MDKRLVRILWRDAEHMIKDTWTDDESVQEFADEDYLLVTVGWIMKKTDKYYTIASDWDEHLDNWGAVRKIPVSMVQSVVDLVDRTEQSSQVPVAEHHPSLSPEAHK